MDRARLKIAG